MTLWQRLSVALTLPFFSCCVALAQNVVRVSEPDAINPAEVSIAINPRNPDNMVGASFQRGRPPRPSSGSYNYLTLDGGKTWKTVPTVDPHNLTQGDDAVSFGADGSVYHAHLSFVGIRVLRPARAESGIIVDSSRDGGLSWNDPVPAI